MEHAYIAVTKSNDAWGVFLFSTSLDRSIVSFIHVPVHGSSENKETRSVALLAPTTCQVISTGSTQRVSVSLLLSSVLTIHICMYIIRHMYSSLQYVIYANNACMHTYNNNMYLAPQLIVIIPAAPRHIPNGCDYPSTRKSFFVAFMLLQNLVD